MVGAVCVCLGCSTQNEEATINSGFFSSSHFFLSSSYFWNCAWGFNSQKKEVNKIWGPLPPPHPPWGGLWLLVVLNQTCEPNIFHWCQWEAERRVMHAQTQEWGTPLEPAKICISYSSLTDYRSNTTNGPRTPGRKVTTAKRREITPLLLSAYNNQGQGTHFAWINLQISIQPPVGQP